MMPEFKRSVYWDSCAFLSFIEETDGRVESLRAVMEEAIKREVALYTSAISITEVAFVAAEHSGGLDEDTEQKIDKLWHPSSPVQVVEYTQLIAIQARQLLRQKLDLGISLKPMDAIHIATALRAQVDELHTYDDRMKKWREHTGIRIVEPAPVQMLLATSDAQTKTKEKQEGPSEP